MSVRLSLRSVPVISVLLAAIVLVRAGDTNVAPPVSDTTREHCWKEDLEYLERELPAKHLDFFKLIPKSRFEGEIRSLKRQLPRLSDAEIVFRVMRLVASLGQSHTWAGFPPGSPVFRGYPLVLHWFSDGLAVIAAGQEYRELVGARLVKIGSLTPKEAVAAVAPYISHENEEWLYDQSASMLRQAELLRYLGIARPDGHLQLVAARPDGKSTSVLVAPAAVDTPMKWVSALEVFGIPDALYRKRHDAYWFEWLPEAHSLYVQYNQCRDLPERPFASFAQALFAVADSNTVRRVIVDLRQNGGGNSRVVKPLVNGLKARPHITGKEHLYVLIGRKTISSGVWAAIDLQKEAGATLVGQPTGGKPNGYGNSPSMRLPNSQMEVRYCTRLYRLIKNADPSSLFPDVPVAASLQEFLAGRDPALDAALGRHASE